MSNDLHWDFESPSPLPPNRQAGRASHDFTSKQRATHLCWRRSGWASSRRRHLHCRSHPDCPPARVPRAPVPADVYSAYMKEATQQLLLEVQSQILLVNSRTSAWTVAQALELRKAISSARSLLFHLTNCTRLPVVCALIDNGNDVIKRSKGQVE